MALYLKVYQENGAPVEGANLTIKGETLTVSGATGNFSVCAAEGDEIVAKKDGYGNTKVKVDQSKFLDFVLPVGE